MSDSVELNETEQEALASAEADMEAQEVNTDTYPEDAASSPSAADPREDQGGTEAAEVQPEDNWQTALQEAGFQSFADVDNAVRALVDANRQRDQQISNYSDQIKFYQEQLRSRDLAQQNVVTEPVKEEKDALDSLIEGWQDPSWAHKYIEVDDEGNRVIADHADDDIRQRIMEMDRSLRQWQEVLQDPRQFASAIDRRVERMIQDKFENSYQEKQAQAQEKASIDSFVNQNASWLYQRDPATGQYIVDPVTNNYVYSEAGSRFTGYMDQLNSRGVTSISDQIEFASQMMGTQQQASSQQSAQTTQRSIDDQRRAMRGRTNTNRTRQTSFNGVNPDSGSGTTGEQQLSFGELTLAAMKEGTE